MNRETALENFLRSFKVALNNASTYFKEHPLFLKSVQDFADRTKELLTFLDPLVIGIAPQGLMIEGVMHESTRNVMYDKVKLYVELGQFLHYRKIKSVQITSGASTEELSSLLKSLVLSPKDIIKAGGVHQILARDGVTHCIIEELDYSHFLKGEGSEYKDIWIYMLRDAVEKKDNALISEFVLNFKALIDKVRAKELLEDEALRESIDKFLEYLKTQNTANFRKCMQELMRAVIRDKSIAQDAKAALLKSLFKDLSTADSVEALLDEIIANDNFDSLNLQLFTNLIDKSEQANAADQLTRNIASKIKDNPRLGKRIQELFRVSVNSDLPEVYLNALSSFADSVAHGEASLDQERLRANYQSMLLNLLAQEHLTERLKIILGKLITEWEYIAKRKDIQYLKNVLLVLEKKQEDASDKSIFEDINRHIAHFTEALVLGEESSADLYFFVAMLKEPAHDVHFYLEKMFVEKKINPYILTLVFRFYSQYLPLLRKNIKEQYANVGLLKKMIESLQAVDVPAGVQLLEYIFMYANNFLKVEALRTMRNLSNTDNEFLFSILSSPDFFIRKESFAILVRSEPTCRRALAVLLEIRSPLGMKNSVLIENISIVRDIAPGSAKEHIQALGRRKYFWNRSLREAARKALEQNNE